VTWSRPDSGSSLYGASPDPLFFSPLHLLPLFSPLLLYSPLLYIHLLHYYGSIPLLWFASFWVVLPLFNLGFANFI
jgi:hypothetical protein